MDNGAAKNFFRQKTLPNCRNIYSADNPGIDHPTALEDDVQEKLQDFKSPLHFASGYEMVSRAVTSKQVIPSEEYLSIISFYLANIYPGYSYGLTYANAVSTGDELFPKFDDTKRYCYHIPAKLQSPGREFKVIQIVGGQPMVLEDLDQSDSTITFATNMGTFNYSIIYK